METWRSVLLLCLFASEVSDIFEFSRQMAQDVLLRFATNNQNVGDYSELERAHLNLFYPVAKAHELQRWNAVIQYASVFSHCLKLRAYWDDALEGVGERLIAAEQLHDIRKVAIAYRSLADVYQRQGYWEHYVYP